MAPSSKKTSSTPNATTLNLMRALRKNKSVSTNKKAVSSPCLGNSSPVSVRKKNAISTKVRKQISKKRTPVEEPITKKQEGLKLLKRGAVTMHRILRRKMLGIKHFVTFNRKGEPYGPKAAEMQSYIGVLARTKPPIWHKSWKEVPKERKEKIWDCVQMAYDIPLTAKRMVLKSACQKWREFKCRLTTRYVLPYRNQPEMLKYPPADYSFIEKGHWDQFVVDRLSADFLVIHEDHKKIRELNIYPHRMSRKGYANLEQEIAEGDTEMEIDRSTTWTRARKDKDGNFMKAVGDIVTEIDKMKQKVLDGEEIEEGVDDVLTKVLGNPEHRGRVRGQGSQVKQSVYFHLPRQKRGKSNIEEKIQEGIQKFMSEQTSKIIEERDAFWAKEMEKLKAALCGKDIRLDGSPLINSQQGSCSKGGSAALGKDLGLNEGPRKKLKLTEDCVDEVEEEDHAVGKTTQLGEEMVKENNQEVGKSVTVVDEQLEVRGLKNDSERKLAVGSPTNFVAYGTVDTISDVLHGKPLEKENARVSITRVIQGTAKIPFPIGDEIVTVEQACGTFIAWPRDLILEEDSGALVNPNAKVNTKNAGKKSKKLNKPDAMVEMAADSPPILKRLLDWGKDALDDGRTISFTLCEEAFGSNKKKVLYFSDVQALCCGGEISRSIICMYIHVLENYLEKDKMTDMVTFVDPGIIGAIGCGSVAERARSLSARFKNAKKGQYFLLPYHHVNHWALTVVNPEAQTVCHMDPLKRRIASEEWIELVDNGIKLYKESARKILKKKIVWENMAGVPVQTGTKDCGLFVMRYMKEICEDKDLNFASKWLRRKNLAYSVSDINEMKVEWANFFMKHHAH